MNFGLFSQSLMTVGADAECSRGLAGLPEVRATLTQGTSIRKSRKNLALKMYATAEPNQHLLG